MQSKFFDQELALDSNIFERQSKRSILFAKSIVRDLIIAKFDQRINTMQNDIIKNVMIVLTSLIQAKFAKIRVLSLSISSIKKFSKVSQIDANTSLQFALSSLSTSRTLAKNASKLRAKEMKFFDSKYQSERTSIIIVAIINASKYVFYRDIYVFVNRLKDLIVLHNNNAIKNILVVCLRDFALIWYSIKLLDITCTNLRLIVSIDNWYYFLINKFKMRISTTLA